MWSLYLVNAFQSAILASLTPYATSAFASHSLLTVISIVSNAMTAAIYIPLAKMLDLWGRAEGFLLMILFATLGMIMMAGSNGIATFCAAQVQPAPEILYLNLLTYLKVFYSIGFGGMTYCIDVITADVSKLKNRGLAYAFTSSPYMITAFAGPAAADAFEAHVGWRWGFGAFAIILPVVAAPLYIILKLNLKKAENRGLLVREGSGRTLSASIWHYTVEFDGKSYISLVNVLTHS
jgi:MFS family permease